MGMFSDLLDEHAPLPQEMMQDDTIGTALSKGWSSGLRGAGSQLQSVAGMAGELVGADEFAKNRYTAAEGLRQDAARMAPQINKWDDVHGFGDTLRYGAGLVGSSMPVSLAAMAAAGLTGGGAVPGMLAAGAATAPFEIGDTWQRQQDSPDAMQQSLGERATGAVLGGLGSAAFQGIVPGIVGKQLAGHGAAGAAKQSLRQMYGKNVLGDAALESVAEGGGDVLKQYGANTEAPTDWDSVKENMIGGGIAGGAMGHIGLAGEAAHSIRPQVGEALGSAMSSINDRLASARSGVEGKLTEAGETAPGKKVRSVYADMGDMLNKAKTKVDSTLDKIMKGEELGIDPKELATATAERAKEMFDFSDNERYKATMQWGKEMLDDAGLDEAKRAEIMDAMGNAKDRAAQVTIATAKKAWNLGKAAASKIDAFATAVKENHEAYKRRDVDGEARFADVNEDGSPVVPEEFDKLGYTQGQTGAPKTEAPKPQPKAPSSPDDIIDEILNRQEEAPTRKPEPKQWGPADRKAFIDEKLAEGMTKDEARQAFKDTYLKSEDYSGAEEAIHTALVETGLAKRRPDLFASNDSINQMRSTLRLVGEMIPKGPLSPKVVEAFTDVFGTDSLDVLESIQSALGGNKLDPIAVEKTFANLNRIEASHNNKTKAHEQLGALVDTDSKDTEAASDMPKVLALMIAHARGETTKGMDPKSEQYRAYNTRFAALTQRLFGKNADTAYKLAEDQARQVKSGMYDTDGNLRGTDSVEGNQEAEFNDAGNDIDTNSNEAQDSEVGYNPLGGKVQFDEAGNRMEGAQKHKVKYGLSKPDVKGKSKSAINGLAMQEGSQYANQHQLDLERQYSTLDDEGNVVRTAAQNGVQIYFERLTGSGSTDPSAVGATGADGRATAKQRAAHGDVSVNGQVVPADKMGHIIVEDRRNPHEFSAEDLAGMKLDTSKYPKSASRLEIGGHIIDAKRVAEVARGKMQDRFENDKPKNYTQRLIDGFKQGIAMLNQQYGEKGKLWSANPKNPERDIPTLRIDELRMQYNQAKKGGANPAVLRQLKAEADSIRAGEGGMIIPDTTVIGFVTAKGRRKPLTWGEAKKMDFRTSSEKIQDADQQRIVELRKQWKAATDAGKPQAVIDTIMDEYKDMVGDQKWALRQEQEKGEDYMGSDQTRRPPTERPKSAEHYDALIGAAQSDLRALHRQIADARTAGATPKAISTLQARAKTLGDELSSHQAAKAAAPRGVKAADDSVAPFDGPWTEPDYHEISRATIAGATIITDTHAGRKRDYNVGERKVANHLRAQGYAEYEPGKWTPGGKEPVGDGGYGFNLTPRNNYHDKDQLKADYATHFIGRGHKKSSTAAYAADAKKQGIPVNAGKYEAENYVFVSSNGQGDVKKSDGKYLQEGGGRDTRFDKNTGQLTKEGANEVLQGNYHGGINPQAGRPSWAEQDQKNSNGELMAFPSPARMEMPGDRPFDAGQGRRKIGNDENIHLAEALAGDREPPLYAGGGEPKKAGAIRDDFRSTAGGLDRGRSNMDGSGHWVGTGTRLLYNNLVDIVHSWDGTASVAAQTIKTRALVLLNNMGKMSERDRKRLIAMAPEPETGKVESTVTYADKGIANATLHQTIDLMTERQVVMELNRRQIIMEQMPENASERWRGMIRNEIKLLEGQLDSGKFGKGMRRSDADVTPAQASALVNELARKYKAVIDTGKTENLSIVAKKGKIPKNPVRFNDNGKATSATEQSANATVSDSYTTADLARDEAARKKNTSGSSGAANQRNVITTAVRARAQRQAELNTAQNSHEPVPRSTDGGRVPDQRDLPGKDAVNARDNMTKATPEQLAALVAEKGKPRPKAQAPAQGASSGDKQAALTEAAKRDDPALIKELGEADSAASLKRGIDTLIASAPESEALKVANERMAKLVQDEDTAYGLSTVMYSLESTRIHEDLGREGFAATHDSPSRHEGVFNWRAKRLSGMGVTTEGTGTYLSSGEITNGVYKAIFTEESGSTSPSYHVSVNIEPHQLMDLDAKLVNQSEFVKQALSDTNINRALKQIPGGTRLERVGGWLGGATGHDIYSRLTRGFAEVDLLPWDDAQAKASELLQAAGILGSTYDAADDGDAGNKNYVIYDDSKITTNYVHFDKSATNPNVNAKNPQTNQEIKDYIERVLGHSVKLRWAKFTHAGEFRRTSAGDFIRLSVHALNPMSTAYHESLHAFFAQLRDAGAHDIIRVIETAAQSPYVMNQVREFYKNQPDVLNQLKNHEERAAYMYQLWAAGHLKVSAPVTTVFQKIAKFVRELLGIWSNDERALHIMDYFSDGSYARAMGTPNAMRRNLMEPGRNRVLEAAKSLTEPLSSLADAVLGTGSGRLRDTGIPALADLAKIIKRDHLEEGPDHGYIPASRIEATKRLGGMADVLGGYTPEVLKDALEALQTGLPAVSAEGRLAVTQVKGILGVTRGYMVAAGVKIGNLGKDYFPRVWDTHFISKNEQAFRDMLEPYVRSGEFKGNVTTFIQNLTTRDGNEFGIETSSPGMQFKKERTLDFLRPADVAPFLKKDLMGTLASYITQATRKAEWERRLGYDQDDPDVTKLEALFNQAKQQGATKEHLELAEQYLKGVDGTLGDTISPTARRLMGNMVVYQNIRLLPMAAFSMVIDPLGVMVRGGNITQAYSTLKRGIASIRETYGGKEIKDQATHLAEIMGVVDRVMLGSIVGDIYTQGMVGGVMKKANDAFFKYNMVEGLNRSFRVGASEAAMGFMAKHAGGTASTHSTRWMAELGIRQGDIKLMPGGRIAVTQADGLSRAQEQRVHRAVNQWVDGAVLRPDAADKPIWMNDPHYALIAHLKQFIYAFQHTVINRAVHEFKHGNYAPAMSLGAYVPVMIAADTVKGILQGGGDTPEWKKNWDVADYVGYGVQRAGLLGVGQFGVDIAADLNRGGTGVGALTGPTIEQLGDALQTAGGNKQFGNTVIDAMPANALYKEVFTGASAKEPMFQD